ncbi:MAG: hypothetical protein MZV63_52260 [Marinilabiliales bacterium]|nr:hypothetical protein [Marinilabiliales bacterium]
MPSYDITSLDLTSSSGNRRISRTPAGELSSLLHHIGTAAKMVNAKIRKAGLVEILGRAGAGESAGRGPAEARQLC